MRDQKPLYRQVMKNSDSLSKAFEINCLFGEEHLG